VRQTGARPRSRDYVSRVITGAATPERDPARVRPDRRIVVPGRRRTRRAGIAVLSVLVTVLAVLLGSGVWSYSGRIATDVLLAHHSGSSGPVRGELVVGSFADGHVSLRRDGVWHIDPLRTADVYGLAWPGGHGVVSGQPTLQPDGGVVRTLEVTDGTPPQRGARATLGRSVWSDPRSAFGVDFQDVTFPCAGGRCPAWYVHGSGATWMVGVHGRGGARTEPLRAAGPAVRAGMPFLSIGYRNDGDAPPDPSGQWRYGVTEWRDLDSAVRWAADHGAKHVVLFGASMGGAIVASFLQHSPSATLVTGVVLDSPALDLRGLVDANAQFDGGPRVLGLPAPLGFTAAAEQVASWRYGVDWDASDYRDGSWLRVPALVFQGTADPAVSPDTSDGLRTAHPDLVRLVKVRGATHVESWNVDPAGYESREAAFLGSLTG
jgi:uncharacterized protein